LIEYTQGGFGGLLVLAHDWATREQTLRSYELLARYVIPVFQQSTDPLLDSNAWARSNRKALFGATPEAMKRAFTDTGKEAPKEVTSRSFGGMDVDSKV